jgi:hypothetical protein
MLFRSPQSCSRPNLEASPLHRWRGKWDFPQTASQISTPYGILTLEAKWLVPAGAMPEDVAKDPKSCLIAVTIELREHAVAHAARILRESGATPAQVKVGIGLACGKTKPMIADELGIKLSLSLV